MDLAGFFGGISTLLSTYNVFAAFGMTIAVTLCASVGSLLIGVIVAVLRVSPVGVLRAFGTAYVSLIRNTPLTLIVFFCVFGLYLSMNWAVLGIRDIYLNNFVWGVVALSIYHASFVAEALRSGVNTVPLGQAEAARAIGLTFGGTMREVILPQAFRGAIAPLANTLIALTKNTTVLATVTVAETASTMRAMIEFNSNLLYVIFFITAAGFVILTLPVGALLTRLSNKLVVQR